MGRLQIKFLTAQHKNAGAKYCYTKIENLLTA
ncbi:MAG: hypothetical protein RLZZ349_404 [Pseudomonadota bacterium]